MNLSYISDVELERMVNTPTQAELQAELIRRRQQAQAIGEVGQYQAEATALNERLEHLIGEYKTRYQPLAEAMASNPEPKLVPELADLYRLIQLIEGTTRQYILFSFYAGSIVDPLISDRLGRPARGRVEIDRFLSTSGDLARGILANHVSDELERRAGRRNLYSFPQPYDSRLVVTQSELLATGILEATGKR